MEQAVVKILLLGICGYGSNYIKEISERDIPGIKIEGICEVVPNAADLYPIIKEQNIPIYQTPEDFYKEHTADLAVVSTPIHLHYSQIVTCLTHGSNVLTEKPVCTSVEGARKLEQLEKETGKFISVGYQLNYSRDVLALKQDILDDRFGKPIYMKALHAMRRGDKYYARNSWAGHIDVKGCAVNDSPFNNAKRGGYYVKYSANRDFVTDVTNKELNRYPEKLRPQLTGKLMKVDVSEPSYKSLLQNFGFKDIYAGGQYAD